MRGYTCLGKSSHTTVKLLPEDRVRRSESCIYLVTLYIYIYIYIYVCVCVCVCVCDEESNKWSMKANNESQNLQRDFAGDLFVVVKTRLGR